MNGGHSEQKLLLLKYPGSHFEHNLPVDPGVHVNPTYELFITNMSLSPLNPGTGIQFELAGPV